MRTAGDELPRLNDQSELAENCGSELGLDDVDPIGVTPQHTGLLRFDAKEPSVVGLGRLELPTS